jgi:23S rRNA (guanine745-N1)-methyltransferase
VDAGGGTGYYLRHVLSSLPERPGLALDSSVPALRRAARPGEHIGVAAVNLWRGWPLADDAASAVLDVFAPRNAAEFARVLGQRGTLLVLTPAPEHLAELRRLTGALDVPPGKLEQLDASLREEFSLAEREPLRWTLTLPPADARNLVEMGPTAHHLEQGGRAERLDALDGPVTTTASVILSVYVRR